MVRTPAFDKNGIKKGAWSPEEDRKLQAYITRYGHWNWRELPKFAGLQRCGKSCRLRWMNYLRPSVRRGNYTKEEEDLIVELHQKHGNKWAMIAGRLPGRTDNEIKNHWHTHLKKRQHSHKSQATSSATDGSMTSDSERSVRRRPPSSPPLLPSANPRQLDQCFPHVNILESCPLLPPQPSVSSSAAAPADASNSNSKSNGNSNSNSGVFGEEAGIFDEMMSDCFFEFTPLGDPATSCDSINSVRDEFAAAAAYDGLEGDDDFWTKPFTMEDMMMSSYDHHVGSSFILAHDLICYPPT